MLIVDNRKSIPLDISRLDWNTDSIKHLESNIWAIPLHDPALNETAELFAYEIAAQQPWLWADVSKTTVALQVDASRSYHRYSLLVGAKPSETFDAECGEEWVEFEAHRKKAVEANGGEAAYDCFPVMLDRSEEFSINSALYEKLGIC